MNDDFDADRREGAGRAARLGPVAALGLAVLVLGGCDRGQGGPPDAAIASAEAALAKGDLGAARVAVLNAAKLAPGNGQVAMLRARVAAESGDVVGTDAAAQDAMRLGAPGDPAAWRIEAALMEKDGARALRLDADNPLPASASAGDRANRLRLRGEAMAQTDDADDAAALLAQAVAASPSGDARALVAAGNLAFDRGEVMLAGRHATEAIARDPRSPGAHILGARIAIAQRDARGALAHYDRVLAVRPDNPTALFGRAMMLGQLGRVDEAAREIASARRRWPAHPHGLYLEARLLADRGRLQDAQALIAQAGNGLDRDPVALAFAGDLAMRMNLPATAVTRYERAIRVAPAITHLKLLLARAHLANDDADAARTALRAFDAVKPEPVEVTALRRQLDAVATP